MSQRANETAPTRRFHVCLHDASPVHARETRGLLRRLAPLIGRRLSCGVVPDWRGVWPLSQHLDYCRMLQDQAEEWLLHGCVHQRSRGRGPVSWLTAGSDEMNGLDRDETWRTLARGQAIFAEAFGAPARGFLAPGWQRGHVRWPRGPIGQDPGGEGSLDHVLGFFSLDSRAGRRVPLATWSWDCGRWAWLGRVGHGFGSLRHAVTGGVPVLAIHPRDLARGYWPVIRALTVSLLDRGYEPGTLAELLDTSAANRVAGGTRR